MKSRLAAGENFVMVGAHNAFTAKLVQHAGFSGVYISGAGLSNSHGVPDTGILGRDDFTYAGKFITRAVSLPVLADADTGFGDVAETVRAYIAAGISGMHMEDQVFPKRCGHLDGKEVVEADEMAEKIGKAVRARDEAGKDFLIMARTDARGAANVPEAEQFEESVRRGIAYRAAGADAIFPESMRTIEEFKEYRARVEGPLLANMTEFGKSPFIPSDEYIAMGYQIVIFPVTVFRYLAGRTADALEALKNDGNQRNIVEQMMPRKEISRILGYDHK